jgi:transposase InsO family protein
VSDEELLALIREDLATTEWVGEGHRKVWARLRALKGVRTSRARVLRLMREAELLAPSRARRELGPRTHDGTIIPDGPNQMWGTDATAAFTEEDGQVTVFLAVDHCTAECVGVHAAKPGTRYEALEPIHQGVRSRFGAVAALVAAGLSVRHDHGSQYVSDAFQEQLAFLGIESSPAFVRAPEGNGCVERLIRTLKEQLLWLQPFRDVEELRLALLEWAARYNSSWLIEAPRLPHPYPGMGGLRDRSAGSVNAINPVSHQPRAQHFSPSEKCRRGSTFRRRRYGNSAVAGSCPMCWF